MSLPFFDSEPAQNAKGREISCGGQRHGILGGQTGEKSIVVNQTAHPVFSCRPCAMKPSGRRISWCFRNLDIRRNECLESMSMLVRGTRCQSILFSSTPSPSMVASTTSPLSR